MPSKCRKKNYKSTMGYQQFLLRVAKYQPPISNGNFKIKINWHPVPHHRFQQKVVCGQEDARSSNRMWLPRVGNFPAGTAQSARSK
jgi:hypothetical protein